MPCRVFEFAETSQMFNGLAAGGSEPEAWLLIRTPDNRTYPAENFSWAFEDTIEAIADPQALLSKNNNKYLIEKQNTSLSLLTHQYFPVEIRIWFRLMTDMINHMLQLYNNV